MRAFRRFLLEEHGQDLIENTLLVAFLALASAGIFLGLGGDVNTIWQSGSTSLNSAATAAGAVNPGNPVNPANPPSGDGDGGGDGDGHHGH